MNLRAKIAAAAKNVFWLVLVYFCYTYVIPKWRALQLTDRLSMLPAGWLLLAATILLLHYGYLYVVWTRLLTFLDSGDVHSLALFRAYALSLLPKYLPGKVFGHGVRARLAIQAGVEASAVSSSLVLEAVLVLASATFVGLVGFLAPGSIVLRDAAKWLALIFAIGTAVLLLLGGVRGSLATRWGRWTGIPEIRARPAQVGGLFGYYLASWITFGISHWCLARAVVELPLSALPLLTVALAVSWGVGFVSLIAPAGLGVREGVLYVFVLGWMTQGQALLFVTLSRLISFGVELLITASWAPFALTRWSHARDHVSSP